MAIARRAIQGSTGATLTIPAGVQAGDLMIAFAFRSGSNTAPSLPSGWTAIENGGANTCSQRLAYRLWQSGDSNPVFTNATAGQIAVYSGCHQTTPVHANFILNATTPAENGGSSTTIDVLDNAPTMGVTDGTSWIVSGYGHETASAFDDPDGSLSEWAEHDYGTGLLGFADWSGATATDEQSVTVTGSTDGWRASWCELVAAPEAKRAPDRRGRLQAVNRGATW